MTDNHLSDKSDAVLGSRGANPWHRTEEQWDRWYSSADPWHFEGTDQEVVQTNALMKRLKHARFGNTLDLGCGEGPLTNVLSSISEKTWGVDISFKAIDRARQRFPHINFLQGDIVEVHHRPEIASTAFDFISVMDVLYYLDPGEERTRTLACLSQIGTPECLYFFSIIGTGPNRNRAYFTFAEFVRMLSEHFNVIDCFPWEVKPTRSLKWMSSLLRNRNLRRRLLDMWTNSRDPETCKSAGYFAVKRSQILPAAKPGL